MTVYNLLNPDPQVKPPRSRIFEQAVAALLNGLITNGQVVVGGSGGSIVGLLYVGNGPPAASLGATGSFYLDLLTGDLYQNQ